jgi:hypothetical protein
MALPIGRGHATATLAITMRQDVLVDELAQHIEAEVPADAERDRRPFAK